MATTTKARKGDLVLVEIVLDRDFTKTTTEYRFGIVASATREGLVKTWYSVGWGDELVSDSEQPIGFQNRLVASQKDVDVNGVIKAAKAHHWPGHPHQPKAFDSLSEAQAIAKPFFLVAVKP
jgi:hypothetical protein